jgi:hypothetical protein
MHKRRYYSIEMKLTAIHMKESMMLSCVFVERLDVNRWWFLSRVSFCYEDKSDNPATYDD